MINLTCLPHLSVSAISVDEGRRFADKWFGPEHGLSSAASRHPASVHRHAVIDTKGSRVPASNQSERKGVDQLQAIPYSLFRQGTEGGWVPCLDFEQPADLASLIIYRTNYIFLFQKRRPPKLHTCCRWARKYMQTCLVIAGTIDSRHNVPFA